MTTSIGKRVAAARKKMHWRQVDLASHIHVSETTIANLEADRTSKPETIRRVATATEVEYAWLVTGSADLAPNNDMLKLHTLNVAAMQGYGVHIPEQQYNALTMPKKWMISHISTDSTQHHSIVLADGDSMSPTINDGDILIINSANKGLKDGLWLIKINHNLYARRIQLSANNKAITLISDNQSYSPQEIIKEGNDIEVIGKITNVMHMTSL